METKERKQFEKLKKIVKKGTTAITFSDLVHISKAELKVIKKAQKDANI